ncbi:MAG: S-methyl-5-thioribose-1-phosphate isomerase [Bacteroidales bacterium]|nr:S-methyl-5-thioribose-1-phosphate isomerase [Bacteroidales bacterium]
MSVENLLSLPTVRLNEEDHTLSILDQTQLPSKTVYLRLSETEEMYEAIARLKVRGAPAIGVAAAYSLYLSVRPYAHYSFEEFSALFEEKRRYLDSARPTAVNLSWALNRMRACLMQHRHLPVTEIIICLKNEADSIKEEDTVMCRSIGQHGVKLLKPNWGILTHCNAGHLATSCFGTALAPVYTGMEQGMQFHLYADETRPLLQGARLTAFELQKAGADVTLLCDNMAASLMAKGRINAVLVGCDRVAANGDTANKIGTSGVAILAKYYHIPFYVCAPSSTIDLNCCTGKEIVIEERNPDEVTEMWYNERMAPPHIKVYNPAFDVTDFSLITAFITEKGIVYPPFKENFKKLFS